MAVAERLFAPRHGDSKQNGSEAALSAAAGIATDIPSTTASKRFLTAARIKSAAAVVKALRGRAVFPRRRTGARPPATPSSRSAPGNAEAVKITVPQRVQRIKAASRAARE